MLVSVVIPAYNAEAYIRRSIESVAAQTYSKVEVVIVDDASRDRTGEVVRATDIAKNVSIVYLRNEDNCGVSYTRNRAISASSGELVAFLDADDWWSERHIECGVKAIARGTDVAIAGIMCAYEEEGAVSTTHSRNEERIWMLSPESLFERNVVQSSSAVIGKRSVFECVGVQDVNLSIGEDWDYWLRVLAMGFHLAWTGEDSCYYVKHDGSAMADALRVAEGNVKFFEKYLGETMVSLQSRRRSLSNALFQYGRLVWRADPITASGLFERAIRLCPSDCRLHAHRLVADMAAKRRSRKMSSALRSCNGTGCAHRGD